ncbi:hypothetical protein QCA50_014665 [Cerrena zonata]|uniref:T6SS Phospholipase effector Tle1-like catalytic domain-containing protein n=1 Tax=Cerrena zonata TaxID=2478898 RepID=A0AAW0FR81_9APHY
MPNKTIFVFCDGTGNDGALSVGKDDILRAAVERAAAQGETNPPAVSKPTPTAVRRLAVESGRQNATNVLRLSRAIKPTTNNGEEQLVLYLSGVGSEADFNGEGNAATAAMQALGTAVASKIRDGYVYIAQNLQKGDRVCIFGFSRGAYTARKLTALIESIGLLQTQKLGFFFQIWKELYDGKAPSVPPGTRIVRQDFTIPCVGVWDTVGSVRGALDVLNIKDDYLPPSIDVALHAVSIQDNRDKFIPTLWVKPPGGIRDGQIFKEVWFPGAHADVGGGYERHELSDIALFWMAGEISSSVSNNTINIDLDFLASIRQPKPDPWGTSQPNNTYYNTPWWQKSIIKPKTRLDSGQITRNVIFHESFKNAPTTLVHPDHMVTMTTLKQKFGSSWSPTCPSLNAFEQRCKNQWNSTLGDPGIPFERIDDLYDRSFLDEQSPKWVINSVSKNAVPGGWDADALPLYVARARYEGGLHPGKVSLSLFSGIMIGYAGKEVNIKSGYEVLSADAASIGWKGCKGKFRLSMLGQAIPVAVGHEKDGTPLYSVRAISSDGVHCGKIKEGDSAMIPNGGLERHIDIYQVLCWDDSFGDWLQRG